MTIDYTALSVCLTVLAIGLAIFLTIRSSFSKIVERLDKIQTHAEHIETIHEIILRLDERIKFLTPQQFSKETVEGTLKNLGKVKITAEPQKDQTKYFIEVEKPVLDEGLMIKKSKESGFEEKEIELFGREPKIVGIDSRRVILFLPCIDPKLCTDYISLLLKWLDSTYWAALDEVDDYERITFSS